MLIFNPAVMIVDLVAADRVIKVVRWSNLLRHLAWVDHLFDPTIGLHYFVDLVQCCRIPWMGGLCLQECAERSFLRLRYVDDLS
jgi:hypothetical protein